MEGLTFDFVLGDIQQILLQRVLLLLGIMCVSAIGSAYTFRKHFSLMAVLIWAVAMFGSLFLLYAGSAFTESAGITMFLSAVFGAATGAMFGGYFEAKLSHKDSDERTRILANIMVMLAGSTIVAAVMGLFMGLNLQSWYPYMIGGTLFVIVIIIVQMFIDFGQVVNKLIAGAVSLFWIMYMIVDFNRITAEQAEVSWSYSAQVASKIFLDLGNLFLWLVDLFD